MLRIRHVVSVLVLPAALLLSGAERAGPVVLEAQRAQARDPVLFVHGWRGNGSQFRAMTGRFKDDGWGGRELYTWTYDSGKSNAVLARRLAARVDQILVATGARRVDIVTHSMGALATRYYLKNLGGAGKVDAWVSLGGPNHGTTSADLCFSAACGEMRPGSAFLAALNAGDETPGAVRYATWRSRCDDVIDPARSVVLDGADNRETGCLGHMDFLRDSGVYREVRDFVAGEGE